MKLKLINSILCRKFDAFAASIDNPEVRELVKKNTICTGGAIASMLMNEQVNDFDFYFRDLETTRRVAAYFVEKFKVNAPPAFADKFKNCEIYSEVTSDDVASKARVRVIVKSAGVASSEGDEGYKYFEQHADGEAAEYISQVMDNAEDAKAKEEDKKKDEAKPKYRPVFLSANAITLSDDVQIVVRFYGEPKEIHDNYDFIHVTNYWTSWDRKVELNQAALLSLMNKDLRYIGSRYPLCSLFRMRKFINRGWKITAGQILKIAVNLQRYDLLNVAILEEQLTGVDVAYFEQLIERVKKDGHDTSVDEAYLAELVDRLF